MPVRNEASAVHAQMTAWRRQIHAHPETAFEEFRTSDLVASLLESWNISVHRGLAGTGVVGTLKCGSSSRAIALRADMDALHLDERNETDYRSTVSGKMHACGHDGHTAMLLGAARCLAEKRAFDGTVHFIFQPAEENEAGGRRMIEEGLFDLFPVEAVYGLHNMPGLPEGSIALRTGPIMASADFFEISVKGCGTHGAWPHHGIDVISVASQIVLAFNHLAARTIDPLKSAVISVTQFHSGHTTNVMSDHATLSGTTRAFDPAVQNQLEQGMKTLCESIAAAYGASASVNYQRRYPPTVNHAEETRLATLAAERVVGRNQVLNTRSPIMAAEDFGWMLQARPGSYAWLGAGEQGTGATPLHSPHYDFNDQLLPVGASYFIELVETVLREPDCPI